MSSGSNETESKERTLSKVELETFESMICEMTDSALSKIAESVGSVAMPYSTAVDLNETIGSIVRDAFYDGLFQGLGSK